MVAGTGLKPASSWNSVWNAVHEAIMSDIGLVNLDEKTNN